MDFGERINTGFSMGMITGIDYFYGLASILAKIGERFEQGSGSTKFTAAMLRPNVLFRLLKGILGAKLGKRNMIPKDIWKLKAFCAEVRIQQYIGNELNTIGAKNRWKGMPVRKVVSLHFNPGVLKG